MAARPERESDMEEYGEFGDHHHQGQLPLGGHRPICLFWAREVSGIWAADVSGTYLDAGGIADWLADELRSSIFVLSPGSVSWRLAAERRFRAPAGPLLGVVSGCLPAWLSVICPPRSLLRPSPGSFAERVAAASFGAPLARCSADSVPALPVPAPGSVAEIGIELLVAAGACLPVGRLAA